MTVYIEDYVPVVKYHGLNTDTSTTLTNATLFDFHNQTDRVTNYERVRMSFVANVFTLASTRGGSGTVRNISFTTAGTGDVSGNSFTMNDAGGGISYMTFTRSTANPGTATVRVAGTISNLSGACKGFEVVQTINQTSGTGAYTAIKVNLTLTAQGSGAQYLIDLQTASTSAFNVATTGVANVSAATATPAGGSTAAVLLFGTTAGFGVYYGSGVPTVSAAQGSVYLRSDGSSTSTRLYVNTTGSTTWTNVTTAA